jgi:nitrile hydratase accessory protein
LSPPETTNPTAEAPAFDEPWQAEAFALVVHLHNRGAFSWSEWAESLTAEIRAAEKRGGAGGYYDHWLAALESLATRRGMTEYGALAARRAAWAEAYRRTPHGRPVSLPTD